MIISGFGYSNSGGWISSSLAKPPLKILIDINTSSGYIIEMDAPFTFSGYPMSQPGPWVRFSGLRAAGVSGSRLVEEAREISIVPIVGQLN
jgi:hypothetical protein